jgi:hypothetical protein
LHLQSVLGGIMQQPLRTHKIIQQVARRLHWAIVGQRFYFWLLVTGALAGLLLCANRLLGIGSIPIAPASLLVIPLFALVVSLIWHRRPTMADAARRMDQVGQTKDLFLTYSLLDRTAGQYQSLVAEDADKQASTVVPQRVIPFRWSRQGGHVIAMGLLLLLAVLYLPHLDPLGRIAEAARVKKNEQQRMDDHRATALRVEEVRKIRENKETASQVEQAIDEMAASMRAMKPGLPAANLSEINQHQRRLGKKWRQRSTEKLSKLLHAVDPLQDFGGQRSKKLRQWQKELQAGNGASLRKELEKMSEDLAAIAAEKDPVKRNEKLRKLKQRLRDVERFAAEKVGVPELAAAMQRAMRQLEAAQSDGTLSGMTADMNGTLDLAKLELEQILLSAQELQKLEQSLKVLQMAKQLNADGQLDGEACSQCQSLADYAALFEQMMNEGMGHGPGMGNRGYGEGGEAPEDESVATDYQTKRSPSALKAGKVLLSMQSKGMSNSGAVEENYQQLVEQVKQGVSEAILQEQIPPAYHDAIRGYFDTIREPGAAATPARDSADDDDR